MYTLEQLVEIFEKNFKSKPSVYIRCPGRVNLIGEHIDYHSYGVFPMAIDASTNLLAARNSDNCIRFINADEKYKSFKMSIPSEWNGASPPAWFDYALCGWKGIMQKQKQEQFGIDFLVSGDIPPSAGLSSSSSLVCAAALATLALVVPRGTQPFDVISRVEFAHLCAESERFIGTLSGGMDHAAEVLAMNGTALKIDFSPTLASHNVALPPNARFVVAHSNTQLNKAATSHYNERVIEGRIVAEWLKRELGISDDTFRLKIIQDLSGLSINQLLEIVEKLPEEASRQEVELLIGTDRLEHCFSENTKHLNNFKLRSRARHVFSEAQRVDDFEDACKRGDIHQMGELMNQSHQSCAKDYECSCDELDEITQKYREAGALGARLTGAGWGGCAVILFDAQHVHKADSLRPLFISKPAPGIEAKYI